MNNIPIFLICFLIFIFWLSHAQRKAQNQDNKASEDFWARETKANSTRKKDISQLPLLHVKESEIPAPHTENESVLHYIGHIRELIKDPMIDLSEYSNTDLKLAYGVGNFKLLSEYDENFANFLSCLSELAHACMVAGLPNDAEYTYRLALHYGSQKTDDYIGLARVYLSMGQPERIRELIREVESGAHPHKASVVEELQHFLTQDR